MSKSKDASARSAVLDYLAKQNRPYSATDIFNNLHKEHGKTAVVKVLETLAEENLIKEKTYGKQKVYMADQSSLVSLDETELKKMDAEIQHLTAELKSSQATVKQLENDCKTLNSSLTTEEATQRLEAVAEECIKYRKRLDGLKNNANSVSPQEREEILKNRTKYVKEWKKRKRLANDILDAVLEGYPKSKKQLLEEVGVETDEDHKVKPPDL